MFFYVINPSSLTAVGMLETVTSVVWNVQFFGLNEFEITLSANENNMDLCDIGCYLCRDSDYDGKTYQNVMIIQKKSLSFNMESGWKMTLSGYGLKSVLNYRVVWEQINLTGNLESSIRSVVSQNAGLPDDSTRAIPTLTFADPIGLEAESDIQVFSEKIGDWISNLAKQYGFGWDIYINAANSMLVFTLKNGTDRSGAGNETPVIFSTDLDNLYSFEYFFDSTTNYNTALVGGEGEGTDQRTTMAGGGTWLNRREIYIDGSSVSSNGEIIDLPTYMEILKSYGLENLQKMKTEKTFSCEIEPFGIFKLNHDFFNGDIIKISAAGIETTARITEIIYSEDASGEKTTVTL